jgi:hypothetical protein
VQARVDRVAAAAAVDDHVDAAEGEFVPAGRVARALQGTAAVVGGVDVEAAVGLAEGPDVGAHLLRGEDLVEADQVAVAAAFGDPLQRDQLVAVIAVRGGDVDHRPRPGVLPADDRVGEVRAPGAERLEHRRVLVGVGRELTEVGHVAGVGDAEPDPLVGRFEQPVGSGLRGAGERAERKDGRDGRRQRGAGFGAKEKPHAGYEARTPMLATSS